MPPGFVALLLGALSTGRQTLFSSRVLLPDMRITSAAVTVCGSTIEAVVPCAAPPAGCERLIDLGEQLLTPAFINAHTHLPMAALRGIDGCAQAMSGDVVVDLFFRLEKLMSADDVRAFTRMGAYESLLCGVGLVWEHYYHGRALADALVDTGLAGVVAPTLQDLDGPGVPWLERALADTAAIAADDALRERGVFAALGPHATDTVSDTLWARAIALAHECGGLPVHAHVGQSIHEFHAVRTRSRGLSPLAHLAKLGVLDAGLPLMLVHAHFATGADVALLRAARHALVTCPFSHALFSFPAPVPAWLDAGATIAVGTDAAASNDCMNVQKELRLLNGFASFTATYSPQLDAFWRAPPTASEDERLAPPAASVGAADDELARRANELFGVRQRAHEAVASRTLRSPTELLRTVWQTPGGLHPHFRAGAIEAGHLANLLAWDTRHPNLWPATDVLAALVMSDATPAIASMMVAGRWIGREPDRPDAPDFRRSLLDSAEYARAHVEADERLSALLERAGIQLVSAPSGAAGRAGG
ncbi:hypothetical protein KFE25_003897 [Diacronema lutheri]|uniref:Amidohydrolase-related domain-containing protein n=1 Tax=Diacronema lutheri TaxID=2081491 RepID=A0A8J5XNA9_DIALT|nr:hypothetical protein KFE25_003897 [Diacronema lutheri]